MDYHQGQQLFMFLSLRMTGHFLTYGLYVVTIYGIDAVANEIDVVLKFFDLGMKIQDFI
jgi:hypothetical protein